MSNLRTSKWDFVDAGAGLLASGLTIGTFLWRVRKKSWKEWSTPRSSLWFIGLASMVWLLQIPAYDFMFMVELARGYHPPWSDSIAIPMSQVQTILLWLLLPYVAIWLVLVVGARLPAPLFSNVSGRTFANVFWTAIAAVLFVPIALVLVGAILEGPTLMVPFLWMALWLVLCARAAALSRHQIGLGRQSL